MAKTSKITVIFSVIALLAVLVYVFYNADNGNKSAYRPMCYYDNCLMWEEEAAEIDLKDSEYIGTIDSCVGPMRKPENDFECNYESWLGAGLYKDENNNFYIKFLNGKTYKLKASRADGGITRIVPFN